MSVDFYGGIGYGVVLKGDVEEIFDKLEKVDSGRLFTAEQISDNGDVLIGLLFSSVIKCDGGRLKEFEYPNEETRRKFDEVKELMEINSESKLHYYFYYE